MSGAVADTVVHDDGESGQGGYIQSLVESLHASSVESMRIDMLTTASAAIAASARIIYHGRPVKNSSDGGGEDQLVEWSGIDFVWFDANLRIVRTHTLIDMDGLRTGNPNVSRTPTLNYQPVPPGFDIDAHYRGYLNAVNTNRSNDHLAKFCQPIITHNEQVSDLDEFIGLLEDAFSRIEDYTLTIKDLITDKVTQRVAVRLELSGKPVKEAFGIQPTGRPVRFPEHAMYQLDGGKIAFVWAIRDFDTYRKCIGGSE
ncbi:hypothetical protein B0I35DRAFT_482018 [Stachybotrys elegans]|uniref:SnoaL-like domain-containing protein n=1 Tax=Stachybotrys elegans TaxID=80388 RepID=A0A8K0WMN1_9HYPO|nr:hypothetical protein B0I35DRAFT_482018 [Stachybotrys elegans]